MASYQEFMRRERPQCWGVLAEHDDESEECRGCVFERSCRSKIQDNIRSRSSSYSTSSPRVVPIRGGDSGQHDSEIGAPMDYKGNFIEQRNAEIIPRGQSPTERLLKDGATGALRGMFGEFYNFFKHYRIP